MSSVPTQYSRVEKYMADFGSITRAEAMSELGIANLPAVICDLRKRGVNIETVEVKSKNRYGQNITYAKYMMGENDEH